MPIFATYRDAALVDASPHIDGAAKAEGLKPKVVENLWTGLTDSVRNGLVAHVKDPAADGSSLPGWRASFQSVFAEMSDSEASALIRIAVAIAGGTIVEEDGTRVDTKAAKK